MTTSNAFAATETAAGRAHNFSAGPGTLPLSVIEEVRDELPLYRDAGASIMELSHRGPHYTAVAEAARSHLRALLGLDEHWHILFLQGGASLQFYQVPLNFLPEGGKAAYANTGAWSTKAIKEARRVGDVQVVASSEEESFSRIPDPAKWDVDDGAAYVHITSNNTIYGTQYPTDPTSPVPLVCDASSDFLSRPIETRRYGLIYAGAQKNVGPAGATIVLVHDSFLAQRRENLPTLLDYGTHTAKLFHTPPVFAVYVVEKVLRWLVDLGGLDAMESENRKKAAALYHRIDRTSFYEGTAEPSSRSMMNVTFRIADRALEAAFLAQAAELGLKGLKGHRSAGGMRASIYNACTMASVEALIAFMDEFESTSG